MRVFWLKRDELIKAPKKKAQEVGKNAPRIVKIVLFGSLAEGRTVPGSDADILILLDDRSLFERFSDYLEKFDVEFPVDVFPYTLNEKNPIVKEALRKGIVLYERRAD